MKSIQVTPPKVYHGPDDLPEELLAAASSAELFDWPDIGPLVVALLYSELGQKVKFALSLDSDEIDVMQVVATAGKKFLDEEANPAELLAYLKSEGVKLAVVTSIKPGDLDGQNTLSLDGYLPGWQHLAATATT